MENSSLITTAVQWLRDLATSQGGELRLVADSRKVQVGDVFFAFPLGASDIRNYIQQALDRGACAVVYEQHNFSWDQRWNVPHLPVPDLLWQSGFIASGYFDQPDSQLFTIAVTGTNGKTSCTQWLARAMSLVGIPSCVVGTLGVGIAKNGLVSELDDTGFTTPDAVQLQQKIAAYRECGIKALAIEASSIGLQQGRMNGMHVDVAVLTNLTRDHLDFHGNMENYQIAKTKLFEWPNLTKAVINLDDAFGVQLVNLCQARGIEVIGYTVDNNVPVDVSSGCTLQPNLQPNLQLSASELRNAENGIHFHLESPFGSGPIKTKLIGRFNVSNILAVLATLFAKGIAWDDAVHAVEQLTSVAGRMEQIATPGQVLVIIDYAHTPDALEKALRNLKEVAEQRHGKLWCVFGCGGNRDAGKRPEMGRVSELADRIIVTSDNPRNEDPELIIQQIATGFTTYRQPGPTLELDRAKAILYAIKHAERNDVVLLAGKGHEPYQEIKGKKLPFSDSDHAHIALANVASKGVGI